MNMRWLLTTLVLATILAAVHLYALDNYLYWYYRWLDTPMHLLGGVLTGTFILGLFGPRRPTTYILGVLGVAFGWEIFEYMFNISTGQVNYYFDTMHDIVNDCIGALITYILADRNVWRSK